MIIVTRRADTMWCVFSRLQRWRSRRQRARIAAVQAVSDLYYREGNVPRGTFRRLRRAELRKLTEREGPLRLASAAGHRSSWPVSLLLV
jgi:hypothetical protein